MRTAFAALAVTLAATAALPAGVASAATDVAVVGDQIVVTGGEEASDLGLSGPQSRVESRRAYLVRDSANPLTPGRGCEQDSDQHGVWCALPEDAPASRLRVDLGAGPDRVLARPELAVPVTFVGGDGPDWMAGGAGADRFEGGPGNDFMWGDEGPAGEAVGLSADEFLGGEGTDRVSYTGHRAERIRVTLDGVADDGAPGEGDNVHPDVEDLQGDPNAENTLIGTDAANFLWGGRRNDILYGAGGGDRVIGDAGDDEMESRDGFADSVSCGEGHDRAPSDAGDQLDSDCEVTAGGAAPPAPEPQPQQPVSPVAPLHGTFPVSFPQRSLKPSKRGRISIRVKCGDTAGCAGTLNVTAGKKVRVGRRWQSFALGRRSFSVADGEVARLTFRLSRRQQSALRRVRKVRLLVDALETRPDERDRTGALTLRAPRR